MACPLLAEWVSFALNVLCVPQIPAAAASCLRLTTIFIHFLAMRAMVSTYMHGSHRINIALQDMLRRIALRVQAE